MYVNGMGFRGIERVKNVHHTTVITWVKQVGELLPDAYEPQTTPEAGELVGEACRRHRIRNVRGFKKNKLWIWTAVDPFKAGILGWVIGDHSAKTFRPLWAIVVTWKCYFYGTGGWSVYPGFREADNESPLIATGLVKIR